MAEVFRELIQDLVKETTTSSGTANTSKVINLSGAADSRFQTFATAYGTSATNTVTGIPVTLTEGTTAQQTGLATFTHGTPSTIQFTSIDKGGTGITFTTAATVSVASIDRILNRVSLRQEAIGITSADYTSAVPNTHYRITISGLTAARSFQLPVTGVKVGDIVSGKIITNAPSTAASVLSIKTDAAGSLVDGVDVGTTASTKWVYLIQNEHFAFRCVNAGGAGDTDWESMVDGRIPCSFMAIRTTDITTSSSGWVDNAFNSDSTGPGYDVGNVYDTSNTYCVARRDAKWMLSAQTRPVSNLSAQDQVGLSIRNITQLYAYSYFFREPIQGVAIGTTPIMPAAAVFSVNAQDQIKAQFYQSAANLGMDAAWSSGSYSVYSYLSGAEIL
jgi:hypothetical protein